MVKLDAESPLHIVPFEPEIPPDTGNIARLCAVFVSTGEIAFPSACGPGHFPVNCFTITAALDRKQHPLLPSKLVPFAHDGYRRHDAGT